MSEFETHQSKKLYFITHDNAKFEISYELVKKSKSKVLNSFIELDDDDDCEDQISYTPFGNDVDGQTLNYIIKFLEYYSKEPMKSIPKPINSHNIKEMVDDWYGDFITSFEEEMLMKIIVASNYLDIKPLLDLGCAQVATMIRQKSPEEIRKIFKIDE